MGGQGEVVTFLILLEPFVTMRWLQCHGAEIKLAVMRLRHKVDGYMSQDKLSLEEA